MAWRMLLVLVLVILAVLPGVVPVKTFDCLLKLKGDEYSGKISVTMSGYTCQRWDAECPISRTSQFTDADFPDGSKTAASNYCRNPKSDLEDYPWCYIADPKSPIDYELCHIPFCTKETDCTLTPNGAEYMGTQSVATAADGKNYTCQRWDSQTPIAHSKKAGGVHFNEDTLKEVENYCRNPKGSDSRPWCYVIGGPRWEYCDINPPICATAKICSDPPTVENAIRLTPTAAGPYDHRATATYKCNTGYEFTDKNGDGVECLLSGKWTEKPTCNKVKCPELQSVSRATVVVTGTADSFGTTVTYTCLKGYKHTGGDLTIRCQSDKKWSGTVPTCTQIVGSKAPTVPGATLELTTSTILGGVARYKCDKDKLTYDKRVNMDGLWEGEVCSGTPVGDGTTGTAAPCSQAGNTAFIAALSVLTAAAFFTTLGLSITVCKLRQAANPSDISQPRSRSLNSTKPGLKTPPTFRSNAVRQSPPVRTPAARPTSFHNYYRDGY